jgi:hypothetical protein
MPFFAVKLLNLDPGLGPARQSSDADLKGNKTEADAASRCKRELLAKNGRRATTLLLTFYLFT